MNDALFDFENEKRNNYYSWRSRQNAIGPVESYEHWKERKITQNSKKTQSTSTTRIVKAVDLADAIVEEIENVIIEVAGECDEVLRRIGKETVAELKILSPKRTGKYAKSWKYKVSKNKLHNSELIVYNTEHRLTYWLERGHVNRTGTSRTRAIPHISIAQKHAAQKAKELLEGL